MNKKLQFPPSVFTPQHAPADRHQEKWLQSHYAEELAWLKGLTFKPRPEAIRRLLDLIERQNSTAL